MCWSMVKPEVCRIVAFKEARLEIPGLCHELKPLKIQRLFDCIVSHKNNDFILPCGGLALLQLCFNVDC